MPLKGSTFNTTFSTFFDCDRGCDMPGWIVWMMEWTWPPLGNQGEQLPPGWTNMKVKQELTSWFTSFGMIARNHWTFWVSFGVTKDIRQFVFRSSRKLVTIPRQLGSTSSSVRKLRERCCNGGKYAAMRRFLGSWAGSVVAISVSSRWKRRGSLAFNWRTTFGPVSPHDTHKNGG